MPYGQAIYPEVYISLGFRAAGTCPTPLYDMAGGAVAQESQEASGSSSHGPGLTFPSIHHKDAFVLFRAICKLSMKGIHDEASSQSDPISLQNKCVQLFAVDFAFLILLICTGCCLLNCSCMSFSMLVQPLEATPYSFMLFATIFVCLCWGIVHLRSLKSPDCRCTSLSRSSKDSKII